MVAELHGVVVPMVTPFTADGEIDVSAVHRLADHLLGVGVRDFLLLGRTLCRVHRPRRNLLTVDLQRHDRAISL